MNKKIHTQILVIGSGPGGYSAAFRCADLGFKTILVERYPVLGGVCLNVGCIPSKALLHIAKIIKDTEFLKKEFIFSGKFKTNIKKIKEWKQGIINNANKSLNYMTKLRNIKVIHGLGKFKTSNEMQILHENDNKIISFENAIIATGSSSIKFPLYNKKDHRVWNSTDALNLNFIPKNLLIIGGGIIGLEIATIYRSLGSNIEIIEIFDNILLDADKDVINIFKNQVKSDFNIMTNTKVISVKPKEEGIYVTIKNNKSILENKIYDAILIAIGRRSNIDMLNLRNIGIELDKNNYIVVNKQMKTNIPHIYAIGDVIGKPMLAHKSIYESHVAAEVIYGKKHFFDPKVIPYIAYTNPEIGWVGLTEKEANKKNINFESIIFPWKALGKAISSDCSDGITKLIFQKLTNRVIGGSVIGRYGGELLGEIAIAIEMGCNVDDLALTMHAHPTLYESINLAARMYNGTIVDLPNLKLKKAL